MINPKNPNLKIADIIGEPLEPGKRPYQGAKNSAKAHLESKDASCMTLAELSAQTRQHAFYFDLMQKRYPNLFPQKAVLPNLEIKEKTFTTSELDAAVEKAVAAALAKK